MLEGGCVGREGVLRRRVCCERGFVERVNEGICSEGMLRGGRGDLTKLRMKVPEETLG